jgi:hypothetical protein
MPRVFAGFDVPEEDVEQLVAALGVLRVGTVAVDRAGDGAVRAAPGVEPTAPPAAPPAARAPYARCSFCGAAQPDHAGRDCPARPRGGGGAAQALYARCAVCGPVQPDPAGRCPRADCPLRGFVEPLGADAGGNPGGIHGAGWANAGGNPGGLHGAGRPDAPRAAVVPPLAPPPAALSVGRPVGYVGAWSLSHCQVVAPSTGRQCGRRPRAGFETCSISRHAEAARPGAVPDPPIR